MNSTRNPIYLLNLYVIKALACIVFITGCAQTSATHHRHYILDNPSRQQFTNNILLLPPDISVRELFQGGVLEDMPRWSTTANQNIMRELNDYLVTTLGLQSTILDSNNNSRLIHQHTVLLKLISQSIRRHTHGWDTWPHKIAHFDYTVGPGLSFLKNDTVATALMVEGGQNVQTFLYNDSVNSILAYPREQLTFGSVRLAVSLVDLDTGDILWNNIDSYHDIDLRQPSEIRSMLARALRSFPVSIFHSAEKMR